MVDFPLSRRLLLAGAFGLFVAPALVLSQAAPAARATAPAASNAGGKPVTLDDYGRFERAAGAAISNDGKWAMWTVTPNEGTGTLYLKQLDGDKQPMVIPRGSGAVFSENSHYVAYFQDPASGRGGGRGAAGGRGNGGRGTTPPNQTALATTEGQQAPARTFVVIDLQTGQTLPTISGVGSFSFSPDGEWLLLRPPGAAGAGDAAGGRGGRGGRGAAPAAAAADDGGNGSPITMRRIATGEQRFIGNVGTSAFNDDGKLFAYTIRAAGRLGNGVYVMDVATGTQRPLDSANEDYDQLTWSEDGEHLAVLRGEKARDKALRDNKLVTWKNVASATSPKVILDPAKAAAFPAGMVISEFAGVRWNEEGTRLWLGVKAQEPEWTAPAGAQANVDVWHWQDPNPQSQQIIQVNQDRRSTFSAVYDLAAGTIKQVGDSAMRNVTPTDDFKWAVGNNNKAYRGEIAWGGAHGDYYLIDLQTGATKLIEKYLSRTLGFSPDDKYWLYQQNNHVFSYELATGKKTQLDGTKSFIDAEDDHDYEKPIYGVAGWSADNKFVLLNDRYDVWQVPVAGGALVNLTKGEGAKQEVRFRLTRFAAGSGGGGRGGRGGGRGGGGGENSFDLSQPLTLSAYGEWTKKTGYYAMEPGKSPTPIVWADKAISAPIVAKNADRMLFTQGTFTEYPNYWVTDKKFTTPQKLSDANAFLGEYAWGTKRLVEYKNRFGQKLQGTLTLPAGYEPGKKYPMLVYFYELMSNTHHNFSMPTYDDRPHISTYASNGYLVLQPDVVYEIGKPGTSALDCVSAAVKEVIRLGYADPAHIGLQGHSWGGYQSSFILTQTNLFAAIVTGAPPTDLTSFVGTTYPGSGTLQQGITEVGQVRMGRDRTPWNSEALYESQSPIHNATKIVTPFVILHGTADNAVDWHQGLELYAAARRLGKPGILLSYPDEPHHLGQRANQIDFQVRMRQFFDHYLKGTPAPKWMTEGVPQVLKGRENQPLPQQRSTTSNNANGRDQ